MIGGNTTALIERMTAPRNEIGESVPAWTAVGTLTGWLDLMSGGGNGYGPSYVTYSAPIAESSHVFLADYDATIAVAAGQTCRAIIDGQRYDVLLIDDPMGMHRQLELYLKYTGGQ